MEKVSLGWKIPGRGEWGSQAVALELLGPSAMIQIQSFLVRLSSGEV